MTVLNLSSAGAISGPPPGRHGKHCPCCQGGWCRYLHGCGSPHNIPLRPARGHQVLSPQVEIGLRLLLVKAKSASMYQEQPMVKPQHKVQVTSQCVVLLLCRVLPFAIMHFTGSGAFSRALRYWARSRANEARRFQPSANGFKLSDYALVPIQSKEPTRQASNYHNAEVRSISCLMSCAPHCILC